MDWSPLLSVITFYGHSEIAVAAAMNSLFRARNKDQMICRRVIWEHHQGVNFRSTHDPCGVKAGYYKIISPNGTVPRATEPVTHPHHVFFAWIMYDNAARQEGTGGVPTPPMSFHISASVKGRRCSH